MGSRKARQTSVVVLSLGLSLLACARGAEQADCTQLEYGRCIRMADPLLRDPDYVFPDNVRDIGRVCSIWGQFVSCVQRYTRKCFSESRQVAFDKAVQDTKESMRQMCHVSQYQTEYLKHASCMKSMLTREQNCGKHYQHLVRQVYGDVTHSTLCCSHHIFRECMIAEVRDECDQGAEDGQASHFTRHTLDKALSFLREQCYSYVPSSGECPGLGLTPTGRSEDARGSTLAMDHLLGRQPGPSGDGAAKQWGARGGEDRRMTVGPDTGGAAPDTRRGSTPPGSWSSTESSRGANTARDNSWTSSSHGVPSLSEGTDDFSPWYPRHTDTAAGSSHHNPAVSHPDTTTPMSGASNPYSPGRASTFGRGMTWSPSTSSWPSASDSSWTPSTSTWTPASNSWTMSTSSWAPPGSWTPPSSAGDAWTPSPASTWRVTGGGSGAPPYAYSTDTWIPGLGNTVDEPNQQGLTVNSSARNRALGLVLATAALLAAVVC